MIFILNFKAIQTMYLREKKRKKEKKKKKALNNNITIIMASIEYTNLAIKCVYFIHKYCIYLNRYKITTGLF